MSALDFIGALLWAFTGALAFHSDATERRDRTLKAEYQLAIYEAQHLAEDQCPT